MSNKFHETRYSLLRFFTALVFLLVVTVGSLQAQVDVEDQEEQAIRKAVDSVAASVIRFETIGGTSRVDGAVVSNGPSTGLVVSKDGYVISASFHFAHQPASIFARLPNGKRASAEIVGRDLSRKLVLIKIQSDFEFAVPVANNSDFVQVGETVIAVGRVIDAESPSVSTGIVSAKNRIWDRAIQTDAKISPANFGGPLLSLDGKVIGILVPMSPDDDSEMAGTEWYDSGIGFAVLFDNVLLQVNKLKKGSTLRQGLVGISLKGSDMFAESVVVAFCRGSSPAGKAGIKPGDEIVEINGRPIHRQAEMKHALGPLYEGDVANVVVIRDGHRLPFDVTLAGEIAPFIPPGIGFLTGNEVDDELTVINVFKGTVAEAAGIEVGDRIARFNGTIVYNRSDLRQAIAATEIESQVELAVQRNGRVIQVLLTMGRRDSALPASFSEFSPVRDAQVIQVRVAEFSNLCFAVVPEPVEGGSDPALLVWIPEPGKLEKETIEKMWREHCRTHNVAVLVPQSANEKSWTAGEVEYIVNAVDTLAKHAKFDSSRVVVGGTKTGGAMASLVAFSQRDLFQGLVVVDSSLSRRARGIATSPVEPLLVLFGSSGPMSESQKSSVVKLKNAYFPLSIEEKAKDVPFANWVDDLFKWTRSVNRF